MLSQAHLHAPNVVDAATQRGICPCQGQSATDVDVASPAAAPEAAWPLHPVSLDLLGALTRIIAAHQHSLLCHIRGYGETHRSSSSKKLHLADTVRLQPGISKEASLITAVLTLGA